MNTNTLWQSIKGSKKAFVAAFGVFLTFVLVTLSHNGGRNLSAKEWITAGVGFVVAHALTWVVSNEGTLPISSLLSALMANPTVTTALASLGITGVSPLVEPTAPAPAPVPAVPADVPVIADPLPATEPVVATNTTTLTGTPDAPPASIPLITGVTAMHGRHRAIEVGTVTAARKLFGF